MSLGFQVILLQIINLPFGSVRVCACVVMVQNEAAFPIIFTNFVDNFRLNNCCIMPISIHGFYIHQRYSNHIFRFCKEGGDHSVYGAALTHPNVCLLLYFRVIAVDPCFVTRKDVLSIALIQASLASFWSLVNIFGTHQEHSFFTDQFVSNIDCILLILMHNIDIFWDTWATFTKFITEATTSML